MRQVVARELDTVEKMSATATVTVNIEDMNDNAPVFSSQQFSLEVYENTINEVIAVYNVSIGVVSLF